MESDQNHESGQEDEANLSLEMMLESRTPKSLNSSPISYMTNLEEIILLLSAGKLDIFHYKFLKDDQIMLNPANFEEMCFLTKEQ